jgi:hypothetical protein
VKLERWVQIAEVIGAVAIVVSLVFVGLQVRQSNSLAATDALREGTQIWSDAYMSAFGTEESSSFFRSAINRCEELSGEQRGRFFATLMKFVSAYDNIFNEYESGRLREEVFVSIALTYYAIVNTACASQELAEDVINLPPYLLGPAQIEVLTGREDEIKLPSFLVD